MICRRPYFVHGRTPVGCGQCIPCRVNRRRVWTVRQVLESFLHEANCFVTLTYSPENLPADGSVSPAHLRNYLKRLRKELSKLDIRVRFFGVGEYGDQTNRPHYHLSLFGCGLEMATVIDNTWPYGFTQTGEFNYSTAQYVCGYTVKKLTNKADQRLDGRHPEFARMSNRPGIGADAMGVIADAVLTDAGLDEFAKTGDVPAAIRMQGKKVPLGRYLRSKLRDDVGVSEKQTHPVHRDHQ